MVSVFRRETARRDGLNNTLRDEVKLKEFQMKKAFYKTAAALIAAAAIFALTGCDKKETAPVQAAPVEIAEAEPNNTELTAQIIKPGDTVNGTFTDADDEDYYKITFTSSGKLTAYTEGADDIYLLWVEELDEDGDYDGMLAEGNYISGYEGDMRVETELAAGTYCLYLEGYEAGSYTLKTSFTPGPISTASAPAAAPAPATPPPANSRANWDSLLDQYEKFVDDYIVAMKKAADGDFTAMTTALSLMEQAESLSERLTEASAEISAAQSARLLRIQTKLAGAAASL
jgi:hypothetical protein